MWRRYLFFLVVPVFVSCAYRDYSPVKKFPATELKEDFKLLRNVLEAKHPSLYWYTPKDSIDYYFSKYHDAIRDSMTEQHFAWHILSPMIDKIHCGHTTVSMSKGYAKWIRGKRLPSFPYYLKIWNDTMAVAATLRRDSVFKRGTIITAIDGVKPDSLVRRIFNYLPEDGYANNINFIRISANFPYFHRNIFGLKPVYKVDYIDSLGNHKSRFVPQYRPPVDSTSKDSLKKPPVKLVKKKPEKSPGRFYYRSLKVDSTGQFAVMDLNSFTKGQLRRFFRRSFRKLEQDSIPNLVLDLRSNSGGKVGLSTLLTKYIRNSPFKVADSVYARTQTVAPYSRFIKGGWLNDVQLIFTAKKKKDGLYHLRYFENKHYKPKKKWHYNGQVYVLINGPTFSAATLFSNAVKGQENVILAGEETGGGWHGNNGIMIPDLTLPHTRSRVTLPLFRVVQFNHVPKTGTGIPPDIYMGTSYEALIGGYDHKMKMVTEMIRSKYLTSQK